MLIHSNIDRRDNVVVSKAPFTYESTLNLAGTIIPAGCFLSLKIYVEESYKVPFRVHSIAQDGKVWFCDHTGKKAVYWQTYINTEDITTNDSPFISSLLFNQYGVVAGHVACTYTVLDIIRNVIASTEETVFLPANALVLIPQCHVSMLSGAGRALGFVSQNKEPVYVTTDTNLVADNLQIVFGSVDTGVTEDQLQLNLMNTPTLLQQKAESGTNGICSIVIDGEDALDCKNKCLIIKAAPLSNLRVARDDGNIVLRGVLNA